MIQGWEPGYVSALAAVLGVALGLLVLTRAPARGLNRAFFALALVHGATLATTALVYLSPGTAGALAATRAFWYFDPWLSALLLVLALHVPTPSGVLLRPWTSRAVHAALIAVPAVLTVAYAVDHSLLIRLESMGGVPYYAVTPLGTVLFALRGAAAGTAFVILARKFRSSPHPLQKTQIAWAHAALLVGFAPAFALFLVKQFVANPQSLSTMGLAVGTVLVNAAALWSLRPWNASLWEDPSRQVPLVSYATGTALALSVAFLGSREAVLTFVALVNLAYPLVLAYAILKFDLFGLDVRLRQAAPHLTLGLLLVGTFLACFAVVSNLSPANAVTNHAVAATVLTGVAAVPLRTATVHLSTRLGWTRANNPAALVERRLEIYRAAVENAVTRGEEVDENDALVDLRDRLALSTRDHRVMVQVVRDAMESGPKSPRGPLREGDLVLRKYRVERFLGSGSFGRAVLATQTSVGRKVVIKEPHEMFRSRGALNALSKEARLAARVNHPNVVTLLDFEELEETGYLVFEYVRGGSLEHRLKDAPMPRAEVYPVFRDMLLGLDAIHRARVVHMDMKPANILLDEDGRAKIADFGIAREVRMDVAATLGRTVGPQAHPGTLLYMAPEQVRGRRDPGPAADLYAAGAILHEMLTGKRYIDFPESAPLIQDAILYKEPALDDPRLTPHEQDLLAALLAKAPADRPQSARDVLARLPAAADVPARPTANPTFATEPTREA